MLKILFKLFVVFCFVGCSNLESVTDRDDAIIFHSGIEQLNTRSSSPLEKSMGVYAFYCPGNEWNDEISSAFMVNTEISPDGTYKNPSETKYWPNSGMLKFFAFYPFTLMNETDKAYDVSFTDKKASLSYTTPENLYDSEDLLMAQTEPLTKSVSAVPLKLNHLMSKVRLLFHRGSKTNSETESTIILKHIELRGYNNSGTYHYETDEYTWSTESKETNTVLFSGEKALPQLPTCIEGNTKDYFLAIPQSLDNIYLYITYSVNNTEFTKKISLNDVSSTIHKWEASKSYVYSFTLYPTDAHISITLNPADWEEQSIDRVMDGNTISENANANTRDVRIALQKVLYRHDPSVNKYVVYVQGTVDGNLTLDALYNNDNNNISQIGDSVKKVLNDFKSDEMVIIDLSTGGEKGQNFRIVNNSSNNLPIGTGNGKWSVKYYKSDDTECTDNLTERGYVIIRKNP